MRTSESVLALAYFNLKYGTFKLLAARWASARWQASTYYLAPSTKVEQLELGSTGKSELLLLLSSTVPVNILWY